MPLQFHIHSEIGTQNSELRAQDSESDVHVTLLYGCHCFNPLIFALCSAMADGILTDNPHLVLLFYMAQLFLRELVKSYRLIQVVPMDMSGYYGKFNSKPTHNSWPSANWKHVSAVAISISGHCDFAVASKCQSQRRTLLLGAIICIKWGKANLMHSAWSLWCFKCVI